MSPKRSAQPLTADPQEPQRHADIARQLGNPASPYLLMAEAAVYLRFPSVRAFRKFLLTHPVAHKRRGRVYLFDRRALDLALPNGHQARKRTA